MLLSRGCTCGRNMFIAFGAFLSVGWFFPRYLWNPRGRGDWMSGLELRCEISHLPAFCMLRNVFAIVGVGYGRSTVVCPTTPACAQVSAPPPTLLRTSVRKPGESAWLAGVSGGALCRPAPCAPWDIGEHGALPRRFALPLLQRDRNCSQTDTAGRSKSLGCTSQSGNRAEKYRNRHPLRTLFHRPL